MTHESTPRNLGATLDSHGDGRHGDGPALIDLSGEPPQRYSSAALNGLSDGFAAQLPIERGQRVGILSANSVAFVAALFGIMRAGGIAVPINTRFPDETIRYVIADAELASGQLAMRCPTHYCLWDYGVRPMGCSLGPTKIRSGRCPFL